MIGERGHKPEEINAPQSSENLSKPEIPKDSGVRKKDVAPGAAIRRASVEMEAIREAGRPAREAHAQNENEEKQKLKALVAVIGMDQAITNFLATAKSSDQVIFFEKTFEGELNREQKKKLLKQLIRLFHEKNPQLKPKSDLPPEKTK